MKIQSITEWLFFHLWKKNNEKSCPGILIPDTIIFRWAQPYYWYFTNKDGTIHRKTKQKILFQNIKQIFLKKKHPSGVVSMSISSNSRKVDKPLYTEQKKIIKNNVIFQYHSDKTFIDFLYNTDNKLNILIQLFVHPKNEHNSLIRVEWTRQFCLLNRKTNIHQMSKQIIPLHDRVATFDGPQFLCHQDKVISPVLARDAEQICFNIIQHIAQISSNNINISKMILYFKLDDLNRLQLLFASEIKIFDLELERDFKIDKSQEPKFVIKKNLKKEEVMNLEIQVHDQNRGFVKQLVNNEDYCSNCQKLTSNLYSVTLNNIIKAYEKKYIPKNFTVMPSKWKEMKQQVYKRKKMEIQGNVKLRKNFSSVNEEMKYLCKELEMEQIMKDFRDMEYIPHLIIKLWGRLTKQSYNNLKKNRSWISLTTSVCDSCFTDITQYLVISPYVRKRLIEAQEYKNKLVKKEELNYQDQKNEIIEEINNPSQKVLNLKKNIELKKKIIKNKVVFKDELKKKKVTKFIHPSNYDPTRIYLKKSSMQSISTNENLDHNYTLNTIQQLKKHFRNLQIQIQQQ